LILLRVQLAIKVRGVLRDLRVCKAYRVMVIKEYREDLARKVYRVGADKVLLGLKAHRA
jgi:hypothetical protein